jgi:hypothetical protein
MQPPNFLYVKKNYDDRQIIKVDETRLYWNKMPSKHFLAKNEESQPGYNVSKNSSVGRKQ